jgi:hypothetical protein
MEYHSKLSAFWVRLKHEIREDLADFCGISMTRTRWGRTIHIIDWAMRRIFIILLIVFVVAVWLAGT